MAFNSFSAPPTRHRTLEVDGKVAETKTMPKTLPMILQWDESFESVPTR